MGGQAVANSPCSVTLCPGPVCVDGLQVQWASASCMAGEENTINFWAVDAYGQATAQDGSAKIMVEVTSGTHIIPGRSSQKCMLHLHRSAGDKQAFLYECTQQV